MLNAELEKEILDYVYDGLFGQDEFAAVIKYTATLFEVDEEIVYDIYVDSVV
jgi:hypothetical protein